MLLSPPSSQTTLPEERKLRLCPISSVIPSETPHCSQDRLLALELGVEDPVHSSHLEIFFKPLGVGTGCWYFLQGAARVENHCSKPAWPLWPNLSSFLPFAPDSSPSESQGSFLLSRGNPCFICLEHAPLLTRLLSVEGRDKAGGADHKGQQKGLFGKGPGSTVPPV